MEDKFVEVRLYSSECQYAVVRWTNHSLSPGGGGERKDAWFAGGGEAEEGSVGTTRVQTGQSGTLTADNGELLEDYQALQEEKVNFTVTRPKSSQPF